MEALYLPALVAAIAQFILGMLWYSPIMFGNAWMKMTGLTKESIDASMKKNMPLIMLGGFATGYIVSLTIGYLLMLVNISDVMMAVKFAAILWFGFNATVLFGMVLWENKPFKLFLLQSGYWLVGFSIIASIMAAWQ